MPLMATEKGVSYTLHLSRETALLLRDGLELLPQERKSSVVYRDLVRDLDMTIVMLERTLKNELLVQEQKRKLIQAKRVGSKVQQPLPPTQKQ
jgi:hypothetical protein